MDVGGGANAKQVQIGFEILNDHKDVKAIFVNIFGGIMKCDTIAEGIIQATQKVDIRVPVVVRLAGTNADKAFEMLDKFGKENKGKVNITVVKTFDGAATEVVKLAHSSK